MYSCGTCTGIVLMFTVNHVKREIYLSALWNRQGHNFSAMTIDKLTAIVTV